MAEVFLALVKIFVVLVCIDVMLTLICRLEEWRNGKRDDFTMWEAEMRDTENIEQ